MSDFLRVDIRGIQEINSLLTGLADKHVEKIIRNTNYGVVSAVRNEMRASVPTGKTKTLKKSISVKNLKGRSLAAQLYFKTPGYYWRFVEKGTPKNSARPFLQPAIDKISGQLDQIINTTFSRVLQKQIDAELKRQRRQLR